MAEQNKRNIFIVICLVWFTCNLCWSAHINKRQSNNDDDDITTEISDIIPMVGPEKVVDLALILDASKSIFKELFYLRSSPIMRTFIRNFVTLHADYARLAVVIFDNYARIAINDISSNQGINKCELFSERSNSLWFKNVTWSGIAGTNVKDALLVTQGIFSTGRTNRPGVTQVSVILTDGSFGSDDPSVAAASLKDNNVTIFTAGIGNRLQVNNVRILGSKDAYFGNEDDWVMLSKGNPSFDPDLQRQFEAVNNDLCNNTCRNGLCQCDINTGISECHCDAGFILNGTQCLAVGLGMFKDGIGNHYAQQCPGNMSTSSTGSTSLGDCFCPNELPVSECEDQCVPNTCIGGQYVCYRLIYGNRLCACPGGYEGTTCDANQNDCESMPCLNGGSCTDLLDDYMCSCQFGFEGKNCEIDYNECQIGFCENSGVCTDEVPNNFQCTCDIGWKGRYCIDRNEDCDNCQNNGTCSVILDDNGLGFITCVCLETYTGNFCESEQHTAVTTPGVTQTSMSATVEPDTTPGEDTTGKYITNEIEHTTTGSPSISRQTTTYKSKVNTPTTRTWAYTYAGTETSQKVIIPSENSNAFLKQTGTSNQHLGSLDTSTLFPELSKTSNPILEPPETSNPFLEPTETSTPILEPTETRNPFLETTETRNPFLVPTETRTPFLEPTETRNPFLETTETRNPFLEPTETRTPILEPTETRNPFLETTETRNPFLEPYVIWPTIGAVMIVIILLGIIIVIFVPDNKQD